MRLLFFTAMVLFVSSYEGVLLAYLDPGTGSVALQVILGGAVATLAAIRLYWDRLKRLFRRPGAEVEGQRDPH